MSDIIKQLVEGSISVDDAVVTEAAGADHAKLAPGDHVQAGYRGHKWTAEFVGFTHHDDPHSETPHFKTMKDVHAHYGTKTLNDLEAHPQGRNVHALFRDSENGDVYGVYPYKGPKSKKAFWAVGSSADKHRISRVLH